MYQLRVSSIFYFSVSVAIVSSLCRVADIRTQQNFDITKYAGVWHELYYLDKSFYGPDDMWEDYTETYTVANESLTMIGQGRTPSSRDDACKTLFTATLNPSAYSGKFNETYNGHSRHFWVLETDYTEFSVTYGCRALDPQGGCTVKDKLDVWVWARKTTMSENLLILVKSILRNACVNFPDLTKTPINRDCSISVAVGK